MTAFSTRTLLHGSESKRIGRNFFAKIRAMFSRRGSHRLPSLSRLKDRRFRLRVIAGACGVVLLYAAFLWFTLPDITDPVNFLASQSTVITDRNGTELYRLFREEDRTFVPGDSIPDHMKHAIIAIEDERFYHRGCLDIRAIARVVIFLGQAGGGSTITRQLARNALDLRNDNRVHRKIKEFILGCQLESHYDKETLLELYLNWIPFGRNAYGVEQAASAYFNSSAETLTLAQSAVLGSLPQRPSYFSPYGNHVRTTVSERVTEGILSGDITSASQIDDEDVNLGLLGAYAGTGSRLVYVGGRSDQVLRNMQNLGFIEEAERLAAMQDLEAMTFEAARENIRAPHFVLRVRDEVLSMFEGKTEEGLLEQGGLHIQTTLDWELQEIAEATVEKHREDVLDRFGAQNIALVAADPVTNEILAYVGNMDYEDTEHGGKIDMASVARQPGSSFKPFVYAAAFRNGYGPATVLWDVKTRIGDDEPQNFDGQFWGPVTIRRALGGSRNLPAAKAYFLAGEEEQILSLVSAMGAPSPQNRKRELAIERPEGFDYGWPLALGAAETPLTEMVSAYSTFAREGKALPQIDILKVTDKKGNLLYERPETEAKEVLDPRIAYQIISILSDESVRPNEFWRTQLTIPGYQTAAKTGTSNKCLEWSSETRQDRFCKLRKPDNAWVVGFTPNLIAGVWSGNADSSAMFDKGDGLNTSSPIWRDFMAAAHRKMENPKSAFKVPEGLIQPQISTLSGQLPTACTPVAFRRGDIFLTDTPPTLPDPACAELVVDRVTGLLASDDCPSDALSSGSFLVPVAEFGGRFPEWKQAMDGWLATQMDLWNASPDHSGSLLPLPLAPTAKCDPSLTPGRMQKPTVEIMVPHEGGNATYPAFNPSIELTVGSAVREVRFSVDGSVVGVFTVAPFSGPIRVPRTISETGLHTLSVTVTDEYFNATTDEVQFTFREDKQPPEVRFMLPSGDVTMTRGRVLHMRAEASDTDSGIKYVQFFIDDTLLSTKPAEPFELNYDLKEPVGVHTLEVRATDTAGNKASESVMLTIE